MNRKALSVVFTIVLLGCRGPSSRTTIPPPPSIAPAEPEAPSAGRDLGPDHLDLEPGWRLRVITPLLRSGGYELRTTTQQTDANTFTITVDDDFLGYETAFYAVEPRRGGGVRIDFRSAEVTYEDQTIRRPRPQVRLFQLPRGARFVRLVWLIRASDADHDMAIVAADNMQDLALLTGEVRTSPTNACQSSSRGFCRWIPAGIAVRPEKPPRMGSGEDWAPAP